MTHGSSRAFLDGEAGSRVLGHMVMPKPSLSKEVGSRAVRHMAARGRMPCPLSWLKAYTRGYSVCGIPIVAPGPTSGEVVNPLVEPTSLYPRSFSEIPS
jgi:hypothetical protein